MGAPGTVLVGTSGYSYPDWHGPFYPVGIPRGRELAYYSRQFPVVELNFTYYGLPRAGAFERMLATTPPSFVFSVKASGDVTHRRENAARACTAFRESIAPLADSGRLCAVLAQFPQSFPRSRANREYLAEVAEHLAGEGEIPVAVEFRHSSWDVPEADEGLRARGLARVAADLPEMPGLPSREPRVTAPLAYVRFHSRDATRWHGSSAQRYDYLYSATELGEWAGRIRAMARSAATILVLFNNCHAAQAARNAREMLQMLGLAAHP